MHRSYRHAVAAVLTALALSPAAAAGDRGPVRAEPDLRPYAAMHWRMIGPFRGGRATAVAGVPGRPARYYFGAVDGGVWRTDDAGRTWNPVFDAEPVASIGAVAVAQSDPDVVYAGTGEADMRSDITYGKGVYKSTDAGATWTHVGLDDTRQIGKIAIDPADPNRVFVAALGHAFGPNGERGVFRTQDGGSSWQRVLHVDDATGAVDVAIDPAVPATVWAALWQTRRPPWNAYPPSNGPGTGLYVSRDGGTAWSRIGGSTGFAADGLGRMGIAIAPSDHRRIYVVAAARKGGVYRSDDGGATWRLADGDRRLWNRSWYFCTIAVDSKDPDVVYVANTALYRSTDGGAHFIPIKGSPDGDDFHQPWVDLADPHRIIVGSDQGAAITTNGGATWSSWFNQPTGQFYHIAADDRFPFDVYGAQQDSGSAVVATRSDNLGITAFDWQPFDVAGESGHAALDPRDPGVVYGGAVTREDFASRQLRSIDPTLARPAPYRSVWTMPLAMSVSEPGVLYFGRQVLFRSQDRGDSWRVISPDLTRPDPGVPPNVDAVTALDDDNAGPRRGVIYAIAPSPIRRGLIWAGTDDGKIWVTHDEGAHWRDVTPRGLRAWSKVGIIEASRFDPDAAYAAVDRHQVDDIAPYLYRTRDGGATWSLAVAGIPAGAYVHAVREDPARRGLLYAGTEFGVYVSFDDAARWQPMRLNMPVVSVRDLVVKQDSLAIATHGRAFWVLDDLAPLHAAPKQSGALRLYAPEPAIRVRPHVDAGEDVPPEEPAGENRADGAFIDYAVTRASAGPLTLAIYDSTGGLVRRWSSADRPKAPEPEQLPYPASWSPAPPALDASAGVHRFIWDFQYAPLSGEPAAASWSGGALAPPGRYTIRLSLSGTTVSQPLIVRKDPRVAATDADLAAQFQMARSVEDGRRTVDRAYARAVREKRMRLAGAPPVQRPGDFGAPQREFTSLWAVGNGLDSLLGSVESADAAPTADERKALAYWLGVLAADRARL